jgi:hypothetical protein
MRWAYASVLLVACLDHQPGTSLGTYGVTGTLTTQTCGSSMQSQIIDPWAFDVRLSRSGHTIYWLQAAAPAISGVVDAAGNVSFTTSEVFPLSEADGGPYCAVIRSDTFHAALGTAADPSSFTGSIAYHYELDQGSDCGGLLAGQFDSIPCDVGYDLAAKRKSP